MDVIIIAISILLTSLGIIVSLFACASKLTLYKCCVVFSVLINSLVIILFLLVGAFMLFLDTSYGYEKINNGCLAS